MAVVDSDKGHIVLDAEEFQLVIHGIAAGIHISTPPQVRENPLF